MTYRVLNLSSNTITVRDTNATGTLLTTVPAQNSNSVVAADFFQANIGVTTVYLESSADSSAVIIPIYSNYETSIRRSPLSFIMRSTGGQQRRLVGTFIAADGRELLDKDGNAQYRIPISTTDRTLYDHFLNRTSPASTEPAWADAVEFRGVLYGGPVLVTPGNTETQNTTVPNAYKPVGGAVLLSPGPVVLSTLTGAYQPATNPGFYDIPITDDTLPAAPTLQAGDGAGSAANIGTTEMEVDFTSCALGICFFRFTHGATAGTLTIRAQRMIRALEPKPTMTNIAVWKSPVYSVEEVFSWTATSATDYAHIELDQGLWLVSLAVTGVNLTAVSLMTQRFQ